MKDKKPRTLARLERENQRLQKIVDSLVLTVGRIKLDRLARSVHVDDEPASLQPTTYALLEQLMLQHDEVIQADPILVHKLRNQLGQASDIIQVVRGQGYTMSAFEGEK
jgi:DNA-binding response OmpR family regulator